MANLLQQRVGIGSGGLECLFGATALGQVGSHNGGIESALLHLVQVQTHLGAATRDVDALVEVHRRVAMRVERQDAAVHFAGTAITVGFAREMLEEGYHHAVGLHDETLGMPLYADDALEFVALHGFYDTVCGTCGDAQLRSGIAHALMVERIDRKGLAQHLGNDAVGLGRDAVCRCVARCLLGVLEDVLFGLTGLQVLIERTAQRSHNCLEAATDAQHRYTAVVGQAYQHEFHEVALGVDAVELGDGLFAQEEGIDVGTARDDQTVNAVEDAGQ